MSGGRKVFVGSLPDGVQEATLRAEFEKFGDLEDVFVKPGCDPGRQWAMITFSTAQQAQTAKEATDRILSLPGGDKPVEVMIARNQGNSSDSQSASSVAPKKIFVGSLPDDINENMLREEFSKYGRITDIYLKTNCEKNKQWGFVTFSSAEEAEVAKTSADRLLKFPNSDQATEVMLARNQGMHGKDPLKANTPAPATGQGPTKIFVGSLPDSITETVLRAEYSRYGQIMDVFLKTGCETNKQWAFIVFATNAQAQAAKDATDRVLCVAGATSPCEVMFAKFQGKHGSDPLNSSSGGGGSGGGSSQPPPPPGQYPAAYAWRVYQTPQGLTYYHNHTTGVTQWECPMELQYAQHAHMQQSMQQSMQPMYGAMYGMPQAAPIYRPY